MQFDATVGKQQHELDELSERLEEEHKVHQLAVTALHSEHQHKLSEVLSDSAIISANACALSYGSYFFINL